MEGFRRYKGSCALLGVLALFSNLLAALALWTSPSLADSSLASLVICTASGAKSIPAGPDTGDHHGTNHCPACMVAPIILVVAAVVGEPDFPVPVSIKHAARHVSFLPFHVELGGIRSRAPPRAL